MFEKIENLDNAVEFLLLKAFVAAHQNTFRKVLETSQKYGYGEKVAGFYRSNHRMHSVKKVFLERYLQNS